jgi:hypothetical protein
VAAREKSPWRWTAVSFVSQPLGVGGIDLRELGRDDARDLVGVQRLHARRELFEQMAAGLEKERNLAGLLDGAFPAVDAGNLPADVCARGKTALNAGASDRLRTGAVGTGDKDIDERGHDRPQSQAGFFLPQDQLQLHVGSLVGRSDALPEGHETGVAIELQGRTEDRIGLDVDAPHTHRAGVVNDSPVTGPRELRPGDVVSFGRVHLRFDAATGSR